VKFNILPTDRVSVVGKTGSGKSVLVKRILKEMSQQAKEFPFRYPIIILDTKGAEKTFGGFGTRVGHLAELNPTIYEQSITVYSPVPEENNRRYYEGFFEYLYGLNIPMLVYIDELTDIGKGNDVPPAYQRFMKLGRERYQALWAGTQNPVFINHDFFSNADHFFIFDLNLEADRKKLAAFAGDEVKERVANKHGFWYYSTDSRYPIYDSNQLPRSRSNPISDIAKTTEAIINPTRDESEDVQMLKGKYVVSIFVLAGVLVFVIPLWKKGWSLFGSKVSAVQPISDFVQQS